MRKFFSALTVLMAAFLVTACTKCTQDQPAEPPPAVEPPQGMPPADGAAAPGDTSAAPVPTEEAPAK